MPALFEPWTYHLIDSAGVKENTQVLDEQARFPCSWTMVEVELRGWLPLFDINLSEEKITGVLIKSDAKLSKYAALSGETIFPASAYIMAAHKPQ